MNATKACCRRPRPAGRIATIAGWVAPLATLTLVPKCPACLAAYLLLATGLGLSATLASAVWGALVGLSIACLLFTATRFLWNRLRANTSTHSLSS